MASKLQRHWRSPTCEGRATPECFQTGVFEARNAKPKMKTQRIVFDFCFPRILVGPMCVSHIYIMRGPLRYLNNLPIFKALARRAENRNQIQPSLEYTFLKEFFHLARRISFKKAY